MQIFDIHKFSFDNIRTNHGCNFALQKIKILQRTHVLQCSENYDVQNYVPIKLCKSEMTIKLIFQMACILRTKCNFLNRYLRCLLPLETVDIEVKIKMMRGIHMFRRDRTTQVIKCNP